MRIILCGKNDSAVHCLQFLVERGDQVWAVGTRSDDGNDGWQRSLKRAAVRLRVPFDQPANINDAGFIKRLADLRSSVLVSIQYDQILQGPLFEAIGCPCINLHFSLLPRNRGVAPIAWAVLSGDRETGATMHLMVRSVYAGDIITQRAVPIAPDDTARQVYDKVAMSAVEVFKACYPFSPEQLAARQPQDPSVSSYHKYGEFDFSRRRIDWGRPVGELHRWLRSMIFPPLQYPEVVVNGRTMAVARIGPQIIDSSATRPGVVVAVSPGALDVTAKGGAIRICEVIDPRAPSATFHDVVRTVAVGDQLA